MGASGARALLAKPPGAGKPKPPLAALKTFSRVCVHTLLNTSQLQEAVYSFSSLRSLAFGLVILMASCAALSTITLRFFEDTL